MQQNLSYTSSCHVGNNLVLNRTMDNLSALSQSPGPTSAACPSPLDLQPTAGTSLETEPTVLHLYRGPGPAVLHLCRDPGPAVLHLYRDQDQLSRTSARPGVKLEVLDDGFLEQALGSSPLRGFAVPASDQVTSTVEASAGALEEAVSLDFGLMLEDYDQGSLVSGVLSPSMFQGLSRTSSRLTTPHGSAAYAPVAPVAPVALG
ncbi:hypothetical protein WMY93_029986 [Mugilogobius chulae]|uniref:Uncharacterized protein n=1 Tax=Mugilogobius chulae TaxID=88201 RepID=A0AAW0MWI4_9GOBI